MQVKSFTYTKANGVATQRTAMVIQHPSNMFMAVDLSELSEEDRQAYVEGYSELLDSFKARIAALDEAFDVKNRIRQFDPLKMTDCTEQFVSP